MTEPHYIIILRAVGAVKSTQARTVVAPAARLAQPRRWRQQGAAAWPAAHSATLWTPVRGLHHTTCPADSPLALPALPGSPAIVSGSLGCNT